jgi:nucleoid-associated protein YgaU
MGKLERAKIYVLSDNGSGVTDPSKANQDTSKWPQGGIEVCFNPKEYSLEKSVQWKSEKALSDAPQPEFTDPQAMTMSVTLQFDTYEERVSVREKYTKYFERLAMMRQALPKKPSKTDKEKAKPPVIIFVWGKFTFKGVVDSVSQKYTMFLSDGTPVRAEVGLKIRNVTDSEFGDEKGAAKAQGAGRSYTVKEGDRLDLIAATELKDASRWPEIASLNKINDPINGLKSGQTLELPD